MYTSIDDLKSKLQSVVSGAGTATVAVHDLAAIRDHVIDELVYTAVLSEDEGLKKAARTTIRGIGSALGNRPASIQGLYHAMGKSEISGFSVPAMNIRGLTYDAVRAIFQAAHTVNAGPFLIEIAKSEIGYTFQAPDEYVVVILAAAIKEGHQGPVFVQGDHVQANAKNYVKDPVKEIESMKKLILEEIQAGFYNIDIDTSTLVDLSQPTLAEQQRANYENAAILTKFIREHQPTGVEISVGGEIGEVGGKNSTPEDLHAFMKGYLTHLGPLTGISKISVQTGTSHGGVVLPDGTIASVKLDFDTLHSLSTISRTEYGLSGAVQHGASTLPSEMFDHFPKIGCSEIHLATEFQNMMYKLMPEDIRNRIDDWLRANCQADSKLGETPEQYIYKTRKKGFGPFKKELWQLPEKDRALIRTELRAKFEFLFSKLNIANTAGLIAKYISM